jgi:hypothetical protein
MSETSERVSVWSTYRHLRDFESDFNRVQATIRAVASTWLLVTLGALAFLLRSGEREALLIDVDLAVAGVAGLGIIGLSTLWVVDQLVYQRLLSGAFAVGLKLEFDYPELPPIRTIMMLNARRTGMSKRLRFFYMVPVAGLLFVAGGGLLLDVGGDGRLGPLSAWVVFGVAAVVGITVVVRSQFGGHTVVRACQHFDGELGHWAKDELARKLWLETAWCWLRRRIPWFARSQAGTRFPGEDVLARYRPPL